MQYTAHRHSVSIVFIEFILPGCAPYKKAWICPVTHSGKLQKRTICRGFGKHRWYEHFLLPAVISQCLWILPDAVHHKFANWTRTGSAAVRGGQRNRSRTFKRLWWYLLFQQTIQSKNRCIPLQTTKKVTPTDFSPYKKLLTLQKIAGYPVNSSQEIKIRLDSRAFVCYTTMCCVETAQFKTSLFISYLSERTVYGFIL